MPHTVNLIKRIQFPETWKSEFVRGAGAEALGVILWR